MKKSVFNETIKDYKHWLGWFILTFFSLITALFISSEGTLKGAFSLKNILIFIVVYLVIMIFDIINHKLKLQ